MSSSIFTILAGLMADAELVECNGQDEHISVFNKRESLSPDTIVRNEPLDDVDRDEFDKYLKTSPAPYSPTMVNNNFTDTKDAYCPESSSSPLRQSPGAAVVYPPPPPLTKAEEFDGSSLISALADVREMFC